VGKVDLEVQLQIWKDLAISKQVLMGSATDALGLDPDCSSDELKEALEKAIKRSINADVNIKNAQDQANTAVAVMEKKTEKVQKAIEVAMAAKDEALNTLKRGQEQMAAGRVAHAEELKKIKAQLADKQKALKAINLALGDSPENVIKKLKTLKKQKIDEAAARRRAEGEVTSLKKEKQRLEKELEEAKSSKEQSAKLVEQHRELHAVCESLQEQLKPLIEEGQELPEIPKQDDELLEALQASGEKD
jgi:chromosome segregation ATPase